MKRCSANASGDSGSDGPIVKCSDWGAKITMVVRMEIVAVVVVVIVVVVAAMAVQEIKCV